jgi:hypothetical protein
LGGNTGRLLDDAPGTGTGACGFEGGDRDLAAAILLGCSSGNSIFDRNMDIFEGGSQPFASLRSPLDQWNLADIARKAAYPFLLDDVTGASFRSMTLGWFLLLTAFVTVLLISSSRTY